MADNIGHPHAQQGDSTHRLARCTTTTTILCAMDGLAAYAGSSSEDEHDGGAQARPSVPHPAPPAASLSDMKKRMRLDVAPPVASVSRLVLVLGGLLDTGREKCRKLLDS